jgi:hypothetical protein
MSAAHESPCGDWSKTDARVETGGGSLFRMISRRPGSQTPRRGNINVQRRHVSDINVWR